MTMILRMCFRSIHFVFAYQVVLIGRDLGLFLLSPLLLYDASGTLFSSCVCWACKSSLGFIMFEVTKNSTRLLHAYCSTQMFRPRNLPPPPHTHTHHRVSACELSKECGHTEDDFRPNTDTSWPTDSTDGSKPQLSCKVSDRMHRWFRLTQTN